MKAPYNFGGYIISLCALNTITRNVKALFDFWSGILYQHLPESTLNPKP